MKTETEKNSLLGSELIQIAHNLHLLLKWMKIMRDYEHVRSAAQ